jgi:hypothetical protein
MRTRRKRPCRCAAEQGHKIAPSQFAGLHWLSVRAFVRKISKLAKYKNPGGERMATKPPTFRAPG